MRAKTPDNGRLDFAVALVVALLAVRVGPAVAPDASPLTGNLLGEALRCCCCSPPLLAVSGTAGLRRERARDRALAGVVDDIAVSVSAPLGGL